MSGRGRLLRCYPRGWRERYGEDLAAYLDDAYPGRLPVRAAVSLLVGGIREHAHTANLAGTASAEDRVRGGALLVLGAWAAFVVGGSSFAKLSEHFDGSLPSGRHTLPDFAYTALQAVAAGAGLAVTAGLVLAVPALVRFLSSGGWPLIRREVARAAAAATLTICMTVAVVIWAHHLTTEQRNGGSAAYSATFLVWAGLVVVTIALCTVAAIATARRLTLSRPVLLVEGALAVGVTAAMLVVVLAAGVWWASVASAAPGFFDAGASGPASGWNPRLAGTVALMVAALVSATLGVASIVRAAPAVLAESARER